MKRSKMAFFFMSLTDGIQRKFDWGFYCTYGDDFGFENRNQEPEKATESH